MRKEFKVRYTVDRESFKSLTLVAETRAEAYTILMEHIPSAEIVSICEHGDSLINVLAKVFVKRSIADIKEVCSLLNSDQQDEFIDALHEERFKLAF